MVFFTHQLLPLLSNAERQELKELGFSVREAPKVLLLPERDDGRAEKMAEETLAIYDLGAFERE